MKVALSEKQLKLITSMVEADGDTSASSGADTASTASSSQSSGTQSSKAGYPAVDKWESGITRGPANPIGVAKWSDVVGTKLTRGHANPLKEEVTNSDVKILRPDGKIVKAPANTKIMGLFDANSMNGSSFKNSLNSMISKENGGLGNKETEKWIPSDWSKIIKF